MKALTLVEELPLLHIMTDEYDTRIGNVRKCKEQIDFDSMMLARRLYLISLALTSSYPTPTNVST